jgi:hypothetical protein
MAGIDYGMGRTNIDHATGIRYGVISMHSMADWFFDEYEPQYGEPTCPKCGGSAADSFKEQDTESEEYEQYGHGCADYVCHSCKHTLDSADVFPEEPIGHELNADGYHAVDCLDSDVMLLASPFYTYAPYCSPCVPGAGNLDGATSGTDGQFGNVKTYCFGHDWFDGGKAPYRVFRVADNSEVLPEVK